MLPLEEAEKRLAGEVVIEEKLDGANLGFSIGPDGALRVQNRDQYLQPPFTGKLAQLGQWIRAIAFTPEPEGPEGTLCNR